MSRINLVADEQAEGVVKDKFDGLNAKLGRVPNIFRVMANSPATLSGYLALSGASAEASLTAAVREKIALHIAELNQCQYCTAAHTAIAKSVGVEDEECIAARKGLDSDQKMAAMLEFTKAVVEKKGAVNDDDVSKLRHAGASDQEAVEIILVVAQNIFTNYINHLAEQEVDFPEVAQI